MNEKAKYAFFLVLVIFVSLATSYLSTAYLHSSSQSVSSKSPQTTQEPTSTQQPTGTKIFLTYNLTFFANGVSTVTVYSDVTVYNLTVVYQYKTVNGGSNVTQNINYGNYYPSGGSTAVAAGEIPSATLIIPQDIIEACSTTTLNPVGNYVFVIRPQLTVIVYGFT